MAILIPLNTEKPKLKEYENVDERIKAFEDLVVEISTATDSQGLRFYLPWLDEIVNIYRQAEAKNGN